MGDFTEVKKKKYVSKKVSFEIAYSNQYEELKNNRSVLYELDDLDDIYNCILTINSLGFLTVCSQPGTRKEVGIPIFRNYNHYDKVITHQMSPSTITKSIRGLYQQRAQVSGFIRKNVGEKIFDFLKNDTFLIVRCGNLCSGFFPHGSQYYDLDGKCISSKNNDETPYIPSSGIRIWNFDCDINKYIKNVKNDNNIVYFCVAEKRINDNTYIWQRIIDLLRFYSNESEA